MWSCLACEHAHTGAKATYLVCEVCGTQRRSDADTAARLQQTHFDLTAEDDARTGAPTAAVDTPTGTGGDVAEDPGAAEPPARADDVAAAARGFVESGMHIYDEQARDAAAGRRPRPRALAGSAAAAEASPPVARGTVRLRVASFNIEMATFRGPINLARWASPGGQCDRAAAQLRRISPRPDVVGFQEISDIGAVADGRAGYPSVTRNQLSDLLDRLNHGVARGDGQWCVVAKQIGCPVAFNAATVEPVAFGRFEVSPCPGRVNACSCARGRQWRGQCDCPGMARPAWVAGQGSCCAFRALGAEPTAAGGADFVLVSAHVSDEQPGVRARGAREFLAPLVRALRRRWRCPVFLVGDFNICLLYTSPSPRD